MQFDNQTFASYIFQSFLERLEKSPLNTRLKWKTAKFAKLFDNRSYNSWKVQIENWN